MVLMHLFGAFLILVAYADYGTEPNSVVQFEIILGLTFVLIGWVLGLILIKQGRSAQKSNGSRRLNFQRFWFNLQ